MSEDLVAKLGCVRDPADRAYLEQRIELTRVALGPSEFRSQMADAVRHDLGDEKVLDILDEWLALALKRGHAMYIIPTSADPA